MSCLMNEIRRLAKVKGRIFPMLAHEPNLLHGRRNSFYRTNSPPRAFPGMDTHPRRTAYGARTLAHDLPPAAQQGRRLQPEVRSVSALADRRRALLGRLARPAPLLGLRPEELGDHAAAPGRPPLAVGRLPARALAVGWLLRAVQDRLRRAAEPTLVSCLDGKPLPVGSRSSDRDARPKGPSGPGYKLHAIWAGQPVPAAWEVTAAVGGLCDREAGIHPAGQPGRAVLRVHPAAGGAAGGVPLQRLPRDPRWRRG